MSLETDSLSHAGISACPRSRAHCLWGVLIEGSHQGFGLGWLFACRVHVRTLWSGSRLPGAAPSSPEEALAEVLEVFGCQALWV